MMPNKQKSKDFLEKKIDLIEYNQSKYNYYKKMLFFLIVIACLCETTYFYSDCQIFGRFANETLISRFFILIPMIIYILSYNRIKDYRIISVLSFIMLHLVMWSTIWAIYYLPNKEFAREGFIIMHFMFLAGGLCTPRKDEMFAHFLVFFNIIISNQFNHYENLDMMLSLGIPLAIGIELVLEICDKTYKTIYINENKLKNLMIHDQLTKAYNRNKIDLLCKTGTNILDLEDACLLIMDIDYFKKINDTYGHSNGDIVLTNLVTCINSCTREKDYIIRWGGEEFLVLLPEVSIREAADIAERIRINVEQFNNGICPMTVSIGVTACKNEKYTETVRRADSALYRAKNSGRNKVEVE